MDARMTLRLPPDLHQKVRAEAERNRRSVHAELLVLIERGLPGEPGEAALDELAAFTGTAETKGAPRCPHPRARVIKGFCYACGKPA